MAYRAKNATSYNIFLPNPAPKSTEICNFASGSACPCGFCRANYMVEKRHCTLCFDRLNLGNSILDKTNAEVTPTGVYIRSRSVPRANHALTGTLLGALYILFTWVSLCPFYKGGFRRPKRWNGQQEIPSFFLLCGKPETTESSDAWVSVRLKAAADLRER